MITGFNDEIEVEGKRYHVQTEDRRTKNPRVQTLVYAHGHIVGTWKTPYKEITEFEQEFLDDIIIVLMEKQHHLVLNEVREGRYDPQYINKLLQDWLSTKTLEEVILEYKAFLKMRKTQKPATPKK